MDERLRQCLADKTDSYIFPFLWLHGESHEALREEIAAMDRCGIREFCAESRVHEDFCGETWWEDFRFLLEEAKSRNMRVWLLDDKRFPTGYANGWFEKHPRESRRFLRETHMDVSGPRKGIALEIAKEEEEVLYAVIACRRSGDGFSLTGEVMDLTDRVRDGLVYTDIPAGVWRVYTLFRTDVGGRPFTDMLQAESCRALLEAVYEPHYAHFSSYFGNTFAGFFSDEPCFDNDGGTYLSILGQRRMVIPWRDDLEQLIADNACVSFEEIHTLLPGLWADIEGKSALIRTYYMDTVTKLYRDNFSRMLGDWCRERGVQYIGHVVEDMGMHMRMGAGAGHFFRSMDGQDMAGMDIVLNQIIPGMQEMPFEAPIFELTAEPTFFNYTLAKLAASHSHIDPLKQGRAMCEIFGAFGWVEGLPYMRQLTDHMLVNGINRFVPHAFNAKYPDGDCPPHFYLGGRNPQFESFGHLMRYMQRMSHLLSGGVHQADVAVFYNAEAEWSGGRHLPFQEVAKTLTQHQIDFDFLPTDTLATAQVRDGRLCVENETYGALLVSGSEILPRHVLEVFDALAAAGLPIFFVEYLPSRTAEGGDAVHIAKAETVLLTQLPEVLRQRGLVAVEVDREAKYLTYYHTVRGSEHIFMFRNSDIFNEIDTVVTLPVSGRYAVYDAWANRAWQGVAADGKWHCHLAPGDSTVVCFGEMDAVLPPVPTEPTLIQPELLWDISLEECGQERRLLCRRSALFSVTEEEGLSRFTGRIHYQTDWTTTGEETVLDLGEVGETAHVILNGIDCGERAFPPYRFDISSAVRPGENDLRIVVANSLAYRERDWLSRYSPLPPSGLLGPVKVG